MFRRGVFAFVDFMFILGFFVIIDIFVTRRGAAATLGKYHRLAKGSENGNYCF